MFTRSFRSTLKYATIASLSYGTYKLQQSQNGFTYRAFAEQRKEISEEEALRDMKEQAKVEEALALSSTPRDMARDIIASEFEPFQDKQRQLPGHEKYSF
jgi:hypothetical protein